MTKRTVAQQLSARELVIALTLLLCWTASGSAAWRMHVIDNTGTGADGTRLGDINGDGLPDIATGWEESSLVAVYLNPGAALAGSPWPRVAAGRVGSPEDAVFADLGTGERPLVVSCCEGDERCIFIHRPPERESALLDSASWTTEALPASRDTMQWMFCLPLQVDGRNGTDLVAGGKNENAGIGWFEAPADPSKLGLWKWHRLSDAGWVMSLFALDMDSDGDPDILTSDRRGGLRGVRWLENPGPGKGLEGPWASRFVGGSGHEILFIAVADLDGDRVFEIIAPAKPGRLLVFSRAGPLSDEWRSTEYRFPEGTGRAKAAQAADLDLDGRQEIILSCEGATGAYGLFCLDLSPGAQSPGFRDIGGIPGTKYDLIECLDLDSDGDLDILTSEEREGLGVVWYENPAVNP